MDVKAFVAANAGPVPIGLLSTDMELIRDIQSRLVQIGLLDPPVDGSFGPVSIFALRALCQRADVGLGDGFTTDVATALLEAPQRGLFPLRPQDDFAGKIVRAMLAKGHWVGRHPEYRNIVYVEGCDPDGTPNSNIPNRFNDTRLVIAIGAEGNPTILGAWEGTSEPGKHWTINPMDDNGAARIAFGQYKSWAVGKHPQSSRSGHEALVHVADVTVFRDLNQDFQREGDNTFTGLFGINQHWGYDLLPDDLQDSSAGCLVGRTRRGHREFMSLLKQDPRFVTNNGYRFMATVMPASELQLSTFEEEEEEVMATVIKIDEQDENQLWIYVAGQRRAVGDPREIVELREKGFLDTRETPLSRKTFEAIPIVSN